MFKCFNVRARPKKNSRDRIFGRAQTGNKPRARSKHIRIWSNIFGRWIQRQLMKNFYKYQPVFTFLTQIEKENIHKLGLFQK